MQRLDLEARMERARARISDLEPAIFGCSSCISGSSFFNDQLVDCGSDCDSMVGSAVSRLSAVEMNVN